MRGFELRYGGGKVDMFVPLLASSSSRGSGNILKISLSGGGETEGGSSMKSSTSGWYFVFGVVIGWSIFDIEMSSSEESLVLGLKRALSGVEVGEIL